MQNKDKRQEMKYLRSILLFSGLLFAPGIAEANIGLPMITVIVPEMLIALIPIILIESYVMSKQLAISYKTSLKAASEGNIKSTIIGIPVTWFILVVVQIASGGSSAHGLNSPLKRVLAVTWQAPWLIPYRNEAYWMVPAATLFLLVPFFFASWWIEYRIERKLLSHIEARQVNRAVRNANIVSYGLLALLVLGILITAKPAIQ